LPLVQSLQCSIEQLEEQLEVSMRARLWPLFLVAVAGAPSAHADEPRPLCSGEYADELAVVAPRVRELERDPANQYSYCLRTTATYECLSYAPDGSVRRARKNVVAHGTAFAYRKSAGDTYLVTNEHVASWPAVTDEDHHVEDVPPGCKMIAESMKIVDDEEDGYDANDVALTRVVTDPALDVAVLKTHATLRLIPWKIGRSSGLHVGNVVAVHGFPLGAFPATNTGKVVTVGDHDTSRDWDHLDFVVDALLSPGNSGSPVLAVSCRTGEYELVGVYHAGYTGGSALNVVVGVDQLHELMTNFKRVPRVSDGGDGLGPPERELLRTAASGPEGHAFFPFGPLVGAVRPLSADKPGALLFEIYSRGFPLHDERVLLVEDLPHPGTFGEVGRVFLGNRRGLRSWQPDAEAQAQLTRIVARLRSSAVNTARVRTLDGTSKVGEKKLRALERDRERRASLDRDAAQSLLELADRLGPKAGDETMSYASIVAPPPATLPAVTQKP
jgi:serine protease Do